MTQTALPQTVVQTVIHYLERIDHILERLSQEPSADEILAFQLAPDGFDTGFHFAVAIQFSARALCPPAGLSVPDITEDTSCDALRAYVALVSDHVSQIDARDLVQPVRHVAGDAEHKQTADDYVLRFALPNMIFHFSMAYAGMRCCGVQIGKADFDGLHAY